MPYRQPARQSGVARQSGKEPQPEVPLLQDVFDPVPANPWAQCSLNVAWCRVAEFCRVVAWLGDVGWCASC